MSTEITMSSCCISGHFNEGQPKGTEMVVAGLNCYVSEPASDSKAQSIFIIPDVFGWQSNNMRLIADMYATHGFYVYLPDFQDGDALSPSAFGGPVEHRHPEKSKLGALEATAHSAKVTMVLGPWLMKHRASVTRPIVDGFANHLRTVPGTQHIGALGFCWGGHYALLQAHGKGAEGGVGGVDAAVVFHPANLSVPVDLDAVTKPLSMGLGDKDDVVGHETLKKIVESFEKRSDVPHEVVIYPDQVHGFAARGDWTSDKDREALDKSIKQGVQWFKLYLK